MGKKRACKICHVIVEDENQCPICKQSNLSSSFSGLVIIIDHEKSEIARKMNIKNNGTYAIRVR